MKALKYLPLFFLMFSTLSSIVGQEENNPAVSLIARYDSLQNKVVLRWAPTTAGVWILSMKAGYKLERLEIKDIPADSVNFDVMGERILPWELDRWKTITEPAVDDDFAAIAAQMIHGQSWSANENSSIEDRANQLQNRYSYLTMATDFSANAALAAGLRYEDDAVLRDKKYLYRISSLAHDDRFVIDTGYVFVETSYQVVSEIPRFLSAIPGEHQVKLLWSQDFNKENFTAYHIERSEDGLHFHQLNQSPYLSDDANQDSTATGSFYFVDSLPVNYKKYHYRILGITPFAVLSPPSEVVLAGGIDLTPPTTPYELSTTQEGPHAIRLNWKFEDSKEKDLKSFMIGHSNDVQKGFVPISDFLSPETRTFLHNEASTQHPNFYIIAAIDSVGNTSYSMEAYAHLIDSIPPDSPVSLSGSVDSTGVVHISWEASVAEDIYGYSVHFANDSTHSFVNLTNIPITENSFTDTIQIMNLGDEVYYKVVAIDRNYNYSPYSKLLRLQKPDLIAPSAPIFTGFNGKGQNIQLQWASSSSKDVAKHELYITENGSEKRKSREFQGSQTNQVSIDLEPETSYVFDLAAIDKAGNKSWCPVPINYITLAKVPDATPILLQAEKLETSVHLSWEKLPGATHYLIYKAEGNNPFALLKKTKGESHDDKRNGAHSVSYSVKAVFEGGQQSEFSNKVYIK